MTESRHHGRILSSLDAGANGDIGPIRIELVRAKDGEEPRLELTGIGAVLTSSEDVVLVNRVLEKGGASEAGLAPGDAIVAIDGAK